MVWQPLLLRLKFTFEAANILINVDTGTVTAVLDWEYACGTCIPIVQVYISYIKIAALPIQLVKPLQHALQGSPYELRQDSILCDAFFDRRNQYIDIYAGIQPQPIFDLASFWRQQNILDFWLTLAHFVRSHCTRLLTEKSLPIRQDLDDMELSELSDAFAW